MSDIQLRGHIIVEYPQLGKYTVLFREGGIQNFCMKYDDLPPKLKAVVQNGKANGTFKHLMAQSENPLTQNVEEMQGEPGLVVNIYSELF